MKYFFQLLLLVFGVSFSLTAQTSKGKPAVTPQPANLPANDIKAKFINDQNYLYSASSLKDYNRFYGDSLEGFDEAAIKAELLNHGVYGKEYVGHIALLKRHYIDQKYGIGARQPVKASPLIKKPSSQTTGRPGGGGNTINVAPCVNEDFELTPVGAYPNSAGAVAGWTVSSRSIMVCNAQNAFVGGSPEFSIVSTPVLNALPAGAVLQGGALGPSPLGGTNVAVMNDINPNYLQTKLAQTFPVTPSNTMFQFAFAGLWNDGGHTCCEQPALTIIMFDCNGDTLGCSSLSLNATGTLCQGGTTSFTVFGTAPNTWSWTNWQNKYIDLTPYLGTCVTIEVINNDCIYGGHAGMVYFDARCGGALVSGGIPSPPGPVIGGPVSFCSGSNQAQINAPLGYGSYQWYGPGNPPVAMPANQGGNTPVLTINNPVPGTVYTVQLVTASGCTFTALDTLKFTNVNIIGLGGSPSCPGGASGSATVQGNGSGTGYNYAWYSPTTPGVIATTSIVSGLAPGVYTITINGLGAAGCGSATNTVLIGTAPPNVYPIIKPFCGNEAYLSVSGSNFQWYNGLTPIPANQGGTAPSYTVVAPYNGQICVASYLSPQGCRDSVEFQLTQTPPGNIYVSNTTFACPGQANASAGIVMNPAANAPPGVNSFSVFSTSALPSPAYSSSIFPTATNGYTPINMPAGTYSVVAFDGSCKYNTTFVISDYVYSYNVSPITSTLCPGNSILASANFPVPITPTQYNFLWSPSTWIVGGTLNTNNISVQVAPVIPTGSIITTTYSITVTPTAVNCPITQTISVTAVNLAQPSIMPIQPFCTNAASPITITVTPTNVTNVFSTGLGTWLSSGGVITPALVSPGTNTFVVTANVSTCVVSSVGAFVASKFNSAALTGTVNNQCTTFPCFDLMSIVQSTVNGTWSGVGVGSNTFCPANISGQQVLTYNTNSTPDPYLCPDTRTLAVQVDAPITPFITPMDPFCTNRPSFTMTSSPSGGTWSSPVPLLITPGGVVNPALAPLGITPFILTIPNGACVSTASTTIDATLFHTAALTGSVPNLCTNSAAVNLMGIVQSTVNGIWTGLNVTNNVFDPSSPGTLATGFYTLTYNTTSSPNPNVCKDNRTMVVYVLNPPTPTITLVQPYTRCNADAPVQLVATPGTGSFVPTSYITASGVFTPSLSSVGNNAVQYVIGTATCNVSDTKQVNIEAFVPPTITGSIPDQCSTNSIMNLASITQYNTGSWAGPGIIGNSFDPGTSGAGQIVLTYNTSSIPSGLCPAAATLAVNVYSLATPVITSAGPLCSSQAGVQLKVSPLGGLFSGQNNTAVEANGWFNPASAVIGDNIVNYKVVAGPCVAYGQSIVKIEKFISADFSKYAGPFCKNDPAVDLNSIVQNPGGVFAGPNLAGSIFTPSKANIGNGNIIIYQTHSSPTESLCPDTSAMRLQVNDVPDVTATGNVLKGCAPVEVIFNTPNTGAGKGEWHLGDGTDPVEGLTATHTYTASGTYTVLFNYWDELGCSTQTMLANPITVYGPPTAAFTYGPYNEVTISDPQVQFTNESNVLGKNTYVWDIDNLYETTDVNPSVTFPKIGKYEISLTATTIYGCKDKVTQTIEVKSDFGIYIPNSFTPNDDGLNDFFGPVFTPYGLDAKTFDMEIFDRWGASLYHTKDVTKGWDGSVQNKGADKLKMDVYVYKIKYKDVDGIIYNKLGHVTLLR